MSADKIDELLGIAGGIDNFLDELSVDDGLSVSNIQEQFKNVDDNVKQAVDAIDAQLSAYNISNIETINIPQIEQSLKDINELIDTSKQILRHVRDAIVTTDLVDSELVASFGKLFEAAHITISEYISLYKSRLSFLDKIKFAIFTQQQKKELMLLKHKLDMEKMQNKLDSDSTEAEGLVMYSQEEVQKMLNEAEAEDTIN